MYVITDDDGRVRVCYDGCAPLGAVEVAEPEEWAWERISDWVLRDDALVYEPLPMVDIPEAPSEAERLAAENVLLKAQVQALAERGEFVEDCIAEMAMVVYGGAAESEPEEGLQPEGGGCDTGGDGQQEDESNIGGDGQLGDECNIDGDSHHPDNGEPTDGWE